MGMAEDGQCVQTKGFIPTGISQTTMIRIRVAVLKMKNLSKTSGDFYLFPRQLIKPFPTHSCIKEHFALTPLELHSADHRFYPPLKPRAGDSLV